MTIQAINKLTVLACVGVTILLGGLVGWQFVDSQEAQKSYNATRADLDEKVSEIAEIKASLADYEKEREQFAAFLFDERDIPGFLDAMSLKAKSHQINITDMKTKRFGKVKLPDELETGRLTRKKSSKKTDPVEDIATLASMPIEMKIDGTFENFVKFFDSLNEYQQLHNVTEIQIDRNRRSGYPRLEGKFVINIYSLKTLGALNER